MELLPQDGLLHCCTACNLGASCPLGLPTGPARLRTPSPVSVVRVFGRVVLLQLLARRPAGEEGQPKAPHDASGLAAQKPPKIPRLELGRAAPRAASGEEGERVSGP